MISLGDYRREKQENYGRSVRKYQGSVGKYRRSVSSMREALEKYGLV